MTLNPDIMQAVERLNYRVTVGDVAAQAGLEINLAQQGLLALASDAGGHLQVAESGEIAYLFPKDFRAVLRNKYFRLQLQEWWNKIWKVLFYLIRISFGIILIVSILLIFIAIFAIMMAASSSRDGERSDSGGSTIRLPNIWISPDFFWIFRPSYYDRPYDNRRTRPTEDRQLNFLEAIFSFLFGDGNPNHNLEERRWQAIGTVIRNHQGAVVAEQIAPYLDDLGQGYAQEYEEYMLPVLTRFNGRPEVSPEGDIIYQFPDLQTSATQQRRHSIAAYLQELPWQFSQATSGQRTLAIGLGVLNLGGAIWLGFLLAGGELAAELGGIVAFVQSIFWLLLAYGVAFLAIPIGRYLWIRGQNHKIISRNQSRQTRAMRLEAGDDRLQQKLLYAEQFAAATVIDQENLAYTTERDLIEQDIENADRIDAEWQQRLNQGK
ncbi:hypothetical protein ACN4EK_30810 [Pantanalinema rosaneae CENA516]|uniref:hypothetical protein n=1 Tax=Pantanalinema rosaneae TaxID=1620701 RepID=UPI003D6FC9DB